jgi:surface polysaccharide O-acyltransferase-like enzyme
MNLDYSQDRKNNYDFLKVVSSFCVVIIHANWISFGPVFECPRNDYIWVAESLINIITRFSVPAFMMISGAFILKKRICDDPRSFYRRMISKVFLPSALCLSMLVFIRIIQNVATNDKWYSGLKGVLKGDFSNLWYIYMLVGVYFLAPAISAFKEMVNKKLYYTFSGVFMIWAMISQMFTMEKIAYSIGVSVAFLSYFLIGDVISEMIDKLDARYFKTVRLIAIGVSVFCICLTYMVRYYGFNYYTYKGYVAFFSPTVIAYSISVFVFWSTLSIPGDYRWLAQKNIYIYAFHTTILELINVLLNGKIRNEIVEVAVISFLTFTISVIVAAVINRIMNIKNVVR